MYFDFQSEKFSRLNLHPEPKFLIFSYEYKLWKRYVFKSIYEMKVKNTNESNNINKILLIMAKIKIHIFPWH